ncbi:hypothetical protein NQ315_009839 [Exocentrus adspersus]|uniref:RanBP2-type domain-containing protein n=1 Tax=Exocentrus adspersus TaxID=1586481 RepID=A0AAV8WHM2_9CUCU|nr:hypothetical protein NQ315_009839 [Exocentrus adspersus]
MVMMENYYSPHSRFNDLWLEIEKCHLSYLEMEESPEKIEQRSKLEEYILDYLAPLPTKKDFSGYKAATGFHAIQLYAGNLLSQPWRKEYRQIKTYCGFYKHQIEANLVGAEIMFEAMGYKHYSDGILELEGPLCPDRVAMVSKDCLIAYVECQIMKTIWEELAATIRISWLEILDFRKSHICGPEQAIKALRYRHHQRQYQEHMSPVLPMNHSFPPLSGLSSHHHIGLPPAPQYVYANGCCANTYASCGPYACMPNAQALMKPNMNGYYFTNGYPAPSLPPPNYQCAIPTGPLINLEPHNGGYDVVDRRSHRSRHPDPHANAELYKIKDDKVNVTDKEESQFEDWDYVYRNLESQGYSKDLGERGDVLSPNSQRAKDGKRIKETNLDEALNNLLIDDRPLKVSEAVKRLEQERKTSPVDRQTSPTSSYENLTPNEAAAAKKPVLKTAKTVNYAKTKSLPREKAHVPMNKQAQNAKTLDIRKPKEDKVDNSTAWQCKTCTFLNETAKDICDMCSKSRSATAEQPMEIGGAECSKCTLVNPKNLSVCEACGASLKGSPTYI